MSEAARIVNSESQTKNESPGKDMRAAALDLARRGFKVFKLGSGGRTPLVAGFITAATNDLETVRQRWTEPFSDDPAANNIGVLTGEGFFVLDVDVKKGKRGLDSLATLEMVYDLDQNTLTAKTPSGGLHLFYKMPDGLRINNSVAKLGDGLDVRGHHGYVVGVGSEVNGGEYVWQNDAPMLDAPKALLDLIATERKAKTTDKSPLGELDTDEAISRATYYLACEAPEAVEGAAGDHTTFIVAARVLDFGISKEQAFELLADWNERKASPPWELSDLIKKIDNAWNYRAKPIGVASAKLEFDPIDIDVGIHPDKALDALLAGEPMSAGTSSEQGKAETKRSRLYWLTADNSGEIEDQPYLVQGLINQRSMVVTYGESNSGKTNVVLDRALHIATGRSYAGKRVHQGAVLYIAAEGGVGIRRRIKAWFKKKEIEGDALAHVPFALVPCPIDLLRGLEDTKALINMAKEVSAHYGQQVVYVVIDTLSRALAGGDENSSVDLGTVVKHCDALRAATGAAVDVIHHSGKNKAAGARGHSLLRAATDTELEVEPGLVRVTKQRDMDFGPEMHFTLDVVPIGVDSEGELVESVVVRFTDGQEEKDDALTKVEKDTLSAVAEMLDANRPENTSLTDCVFKPNQLKAWLANDDEWKKKVKPETARRYCQALREKGWARKEANGDWFLTRDPFDISP